MTNEKQKLGRCMAEDWGMFNTGTLNEHRKMTRCRAAAIVRVTNDVFGNKDVCLCEKHLAKYDELHAVRVYRRHQGLICNDYKYWVMKLIVGEPRYAIRYGEVKVISPNECSHHNRRNWLEATTDELSLWEQILRGREQQLKAHREHEQMLLAELAKVTQKVGDLREAKKEVK